MNPAPVSKHIIWATVLAIGIICVTILSLVLSGQAQELSHLERIACIENGGTPISGVCVW